MRRSPWRKRLAHRLKTQIHRRPALDAWLDRRFAAGDDAAARRWYLRLFPERRVRSGPFRALPPVAQASALVLTLVPPEDLGGGSRPAQLAAALRARGCAIDWRYALPIFPWPQATQPPTAGVTVRWIGSDAGRPAATAFTLALVEAPHPRLCAELAQVSSDTPVVYDLIDVWDGELGVDWYDAAAERAIVARADVLTASSHLLCAELARRSARDVELLPNAVDLDRFDPSIAHAPPVGLRRGSPTIVYVGSLWGDWIDLELVADLAAALPEAVVHLVGPAGSRELPRAHNIVAAGAQPQERVPAYLSAADVAIIPFVRTRLTAAVSPLKAFEYLAMQRPVVATRLPELEDVPGITLADDRASFIAAVRAVATRPFPRRDVNEYLTAHTWQARAQRLLDLVSRPAGRARCEAEA